MSIEDQGVVGAVGDSGSGGEPEGSSGRERRERTGGNRDKGPIALTSTARHPARLLPSQQASLGIPQRASKAHQIWIRYGGHGEDPQGCSVFWTDGGCSATQVVAGVGLEARFVVNAGMRYGQK